MPRWSSRNTARPTTGPQSMPSRRSFLTALQSGFAPITSSLEAEASIASVSRYLPSGKPDAFIETLLGSLTTSAIGRAILGRHHERGFLANFLPCRGDLLDDLGGHDA